MASGKHSGMFTLSIETKILMELLTKVQEGSSLSWTEIRSAIGKEDVSSVLATARRRLALDERIYFEALRGVGLRRLTNGEKTRAAEPLRAKTNRAAKRALRMITSVDYENLSAEEKATHNFGAATVGLLIHFSTRKTAKQIEDMTLKQSGVIPPMKLLEALREAK